MNFLSNIRIGTRLAIGFGIILLFSIVSTWFALVTANGHAAATERMMALPLSKERMISEWHVYTATAIVRTSMIAKSADETLSTTFAAPIADSVKNTTALVKKLEPLLDTDQEKALAQSIKELRAKYQAAKVVLMDAKKAGRAEDGERLFKDQFMPAAQAYEAQLKALLAMQRMEIDATAAAIKASGERSSRLTMLLTALLVVLGGLCAWMISRSITVPLRAAVGVAATVAEGDLTTSFPRRTGDEIGDLMHALKGMNDSLATVVSKVQAGTRSIATASSEIAAGNLDLSARTEQQAGSLEETASSMEELTSTVRQNADNAKQANQLAQAASSVAEKGGKIVGQVVVTMGSIDASARKIVDIIGVIDGIAFQTNILALNAAVEAARAGEQGRGFAVVASEVRNLAQRSAGAAKEIKELIGDSVNQVDIGARLVQEAGTTMNDVVSSVARVTDIMAEITSASREQSSGIDQVNAAIAQMDHVTQQNAALVEEAAAAAASMQEQAASLAEVAAGFRLGHDGRRALPPKRPAAPVRTAPAAPARPAARAALAPAAGGAGDWEAF